MAYRQLGVVTFAVLGLVASACGGSSTTGSSAPSGGDQPPANADQPPHTSGDSAPTSADQPPPNPDAPPLSSEASAGTGGRLTSLCLELCDAIEKLGNQCGGDGLNLDGLCSDDSKCQVPPNFPCESEAAVAFECLIQNLGTLCSAGDGQGQQERPQLCDAELERASDCADAHEQPNNEVSSCSPAGGCDCPTECSKCACKAGTNASKLEDCATGVCSAN